MFPKKAKRIEQRPSSQKLVKMLHTKQNCSIGLTRLFPATLKIRNTDPTQVFETPV